MAELNCGYCEKICKRTHKGQKFCSQECWKSNCKKENTYQCCVCGSNYYRTKSHAERSSGRYCSHSCQAKEMLGENHMNHNPDCTKNCEHCGAEFSAWGERKNTGRFCSKGCQSKYKKANIHKTRDSCNCQQCGSVFFAKRIKGYIPVFCTTECSSRFHARQMSGEGNPRYIHGLAEKGYVDFPESLKAEIRERDGNQCKICGVQRESYDKEFDVHHIDYDKKNGSEENLITVCRFCHGKFHGSKKQREIWKKRLSKLLEEPARSLRSLIISG